MQTEQWAIEGESERKKKQQNIIIILRQRRLASPTKKIRIHKFSVESSDFLLLIENVLHSTERKSIHLFHTECKTIYFFGGNMPKTWHDDHQLKPIEKLL